MNNTDTLPAPSWKTMTVAGLCSALAWWGMSTFGVHVLDMSPISAGLSMGVFELAMVALVGEARRALAADRAARALLWSSRLLAAASSVLAAWGEVEAGHPLAAAAARGLFPLAAAWLWETSLVGELRASVSELEGRREKVMAVLVAALEDERANPTDAKAIDRAQVASRRARRIVPAADFPRYAAMHAESSRAASELRASVMASAVHGEATVHAAVQQAEMHAARATGEAATSPATDPAKTSATPGQTARPRPARKTASRPAKTGNATPAKADRTPVLAALLADRPDATTSDGVAALADAGHTVPDRTVRRDMAELKNELNTEAAPALAVAGA